MYFRDYLGGPVAVTMNITDAINKTLCSQINTYSLKKMYFDLLGSSIFELQFVL